MGCSTAAGGRPRPTPRSRRSSGRRASRREISLRPARGGAPARGRGGRVPLRGKVVIPCAVTGSIHPPTMSPYLPLTPDEIAREAIAAAEAGAAILHLPARDPKDGRPTPDPALFVEFLPRIQPAPGAGVDMPTGG